MAWSKEQDKEFHEFAENVLGKAVILLSALGLAWVIKKCKFNGDLQKRLRELIEKKETAED